MNNGIMNRTLNTLRKLCGKCYQDVKHLKSVRSLGNSYLLNAEQDKKLKEAEQHVNSREVFFNKLSKAVRKVGDKNEEI